MNWEYKICLLLLLISWTAFLVLADHFKANQLYYPENSHEQSSIVTTHSTIWYHKEYWITSLGLSYVALVFGLLGLINDKKRSGWKMSDFIKIEIVEEDQQNDYDE
jgi:hypothetical protein